MFAHLAVSHRDRAGTFIRMKFKIGFLLGAAVGAVTTANMNAEQRQRVRSAARSAADRATDAASKVTTSKTATHLGDIVSKGDEAVADKVDEAVDAITPDDH